jgi:hypothetical protein
MNTSYDSALYRNWKWSQSTFTGHSTSLLTSLLLLLLLLLVVVEVPVVVVVEV